MNFDCYDDYDGDDDDDDMIMKIYITTITMMVVYEGDPLPVLVGNNRAHVGGGWM